MMGSRRELGSTGLVFSRWVGRQSTESCRAGRVTKGLHTESEAHVLQDQVWGAGRWAKPYSPPQAEVQVSLRLGV